MHEILKYLTILLKKCKKKKLDKRLNKKRKELNHLVKKFNQDNPGINQVIPEISKQYPKMKNLNLTKKKNQRNQNCKRIIFTPFFTKQFNTQI